MGTLHFPISAVEKLFNEIDENASFETLLSENRHSFMSSVKASNQSLGTRSKNQKATKAGIAQQGRRQVSSFCLDFVSPKNFPVSPFSFVKEN